MGSCRFHTLKGSSLFYKEALPLLMIPIWQLLSGTGISQKEKSRRICKYLSSALKLIHLIYSIMALQSLSTLSPTSQFFQSTRCSASNSVISTPCCSTSNSLIFYRMHVSITRITPVFWRLTSCIIWWTLTTRSADIL